MGEDLADVMAAAAEDGEERVADRALEGATGEATIGLHMTYLGLDGAATPEELAQARREATAYAADEHRRAPHAMAAVAAIDHGEAAGEGGGDADLAAEFVAHPRLALGDAVDIRLVQGIELGRALGGLPQQ